jgi:effector-binding domain-containing protein
MIDAPEIVQTKEALTAGIRLSIPREEMMTAFGPAVQELMSALNTQGIAPAGAVFAHHFRITPGIFDFEIAVAVDRPVTASGRVIPGKLPATKVARTIYRGGYEGLPDGWGEFDAWMKEEGVNQAVDLWEVYAVGPHSTPDESKWETELNRPLMA